MGRCTVIRWAFAAGVFCCWGCSAPNSFSPFGWMQGSSSTQASAAKDPSNPLKSSDSSASASGSSTTASDGSTASSDGDKGAPGAGFKTATIDPALRKLMTDEVQYEPADKRQAILDQWSKFDPAFIRELVENHRMARELAEGHKGSGGTGWDSGSAVKTASNDQAPGMPAFDDPSAPKDSVLREHTQGPKTVQPAATSAPGAVSPWDDTPATPPSQSRTAVASSASTATPRPVAPAPTASVAKSDAWDFDAAPRKQGSGAQPEKPSQTVAATDSAFADAPVKSPATATSKASSTPKADAFASLNPVDTDPAPAPTRPQTANAASPKVASAGDVATPPRAPTAPNPFGDDPSSQAGVAPPANVVANSQPSARGTGAPVTQAVGSAPLDGSGVTLASATNPAPPNGSDSEQPVKLSLPVDVPDGQVVSASDSGANGTRASQASATGTSTPAPQPATTAQTQPPSGLASLPSRLLGAINPLPGTGGSRNVSLPANWHDELQKIVTVAATEAGQTSVGASDAEKLAYIQKQVNLRMLYLLSGQPARSLEPIAGLDPADQEFWQEVFWGMSSYFDRNTIADPRDRATQTIAQLRQAVHKLQEKSKLELRNVAFCNKIENYGRYERFKRDEFTAGQPVLLYAEVENFKSEPTADGPYRAILKSTIEVFDSAGKRVVSMPFAPNEDLCASPRRDYYNSYEFSIPQQISLGPHTLKLTVEDQLSQKVASYSVNFTVK
jgi:hypothetical protein